MWSIHDDGVTLLAAVAPRTWNSSIMARMFLKEENIWYKMVCYTLYLRLANRQKSCLKVRIYADEKLTFG